MMAKSDTLMIRRLCDVADPHWVRHHAFVEIDHEVFSVVILSLLLIQEGQLSLSY